MHGEFLGRTDELAQKNWIGVVPSEKNMVEMKPLWRELAFYIREELSDWVTPEMADKHQSLAESVDFWWQKMESLPKTLIHHDFNPRNITFKRQHHTAPPQTHRL